MIGTRLSHYEILEEISRGGMGVVYRASDVNLGREVALKVLPEDLVHDDDRRRRLLQEARAASVLEHPHIAVIHEVGEAESDGFVPEYTEHLHAFAIIPDAAAASPRAAHQPCYRDSGQLQSQCSVTIVSLSPRLAS